jgi:glycosyltransferase involved in cell wall biosynthesis
MTEAKAQTDHTFFFWRMPVHLLAQLQGRKIGWLFFESDRIPELWLKQMDAFDLLLMPTDWGREVLLAHGLPDDKISIVPCSVNERVYFPQPITHDGFVFLLVGKFEKRKSIGETVRAFSEEFPAPAWPAVELWIKADYPLFPDRVTRLRALCAHDRRIRIISGQFSDEQMAALYNRSDAFVFPTKAEGFGLPTIEALACGLPVVTTDYGGQGVFLKHVTGLFYSVSYDIGEIVDSDYDHFYGKDYQGLGYGRWAIPSVASIRAGMRQVYDQAHVWRERALRASQIIRAEFSTDRVARQAIAAITPSISVQLNQS